MNSNQIRDILLKKRLDKGWSAEELGKRIGVNKTTIYRYEKGQIEKMPFDVVNKLAVALEINPAFIAGFSDTPEVDTHNLSEKIVSIVNQLENKQKLNVYRYAMKQLNGQNKIK